MALAKSIQKSELINVQYKPILVTIYTIFKGKKHFVYFKKHTLTILTYI